VRGKTAKSFENMVARDGIEPPTPAFSVLILVYPFENTYRYFHRTPIGLQMDSTVYA
jgi:hypothetical protein